MSGNKPNFRLVVFVGLTCLWLSQCRYSGDNRSPTQTPEVSLPSGSLVYTTPYCHPVVSSDTHLLALPDRKRTTLLSDQLNDNKLAWSPNGQMLGILSSHWGEGETLRVVDILTPSVRLELPGPFNQFAWAADSASLYYLDREEHLYNYSLATHETTLLAEGIGAGFSVSPNGRWLGFTQRDPTYFGAFTFRVLDLNTHHVLRPDHDDLGYLGINSSAWSPVANELAVVFGSDTISSGKLVIYTMQSDRLQTKSIAMAGKTYQYNYGQDLKIGFGVPAWLPDGQKLLVIRYTPGDSLGGEVLLFDANLTVYQRLPFGANVTGLALMPNSQWLAYVTPIPKGEARTPCVGSLAGEIWLADMKTLKTQRLVTDTMYFAQPAWRP